MFLLKNNMLSKKNRVDKNTFKTIWDKGNVVSGSFFVFKYIKQEDPKFSFVVSKKIAKGSVKRNFLRRLGYNILKEITFLKLNGIFIYKKEGLSANKNEIKEDIKKIFNKINK